MSELESELDRLAAESGFSVVVRVDEGERLAVARAYGLAQRGDGIPNAVGTRFAIASGTKGLTAVAVASLIEEGALELSTPARSILGADLPLIGDGVTVEHLLAHRSGVGDYLDEEAAPDLLDYRCRCPSTSSRRARSISPRPRGARRSSPPASASARATAATSCSR